MHQWAIVWKHEVIHKTGSTWRITTLREEDWATTCTKTNEVQSCGFGVMWANRQTDSSQWRSIHEHTVNKSNGTPAITPRYVLVTTGAAPWWVRLSVLHGTQRQSGWQICCGCGKRNKCSQSYMYLTDNLNAQTPTLKDVVNLLYSELYNKSTRNWTIGV